MDATLTLVDLAGCVALLMWGVHMVQSGIQRAFGPHLRRLLGRALGDRFNAFAAGLGVTAILQSSTATGLMAASFAAGGFVDLVPALAVMLGANVGTTLIVQLLSFNIGRAAPLFILVGVMLFRKSSHSRPRDLGRVGPLMVMLDADRGRVVADFHTLYNIATAVLFLPVLGPFSRLLVRLLPARAVPADPSRPVYLDEAAREAPAIALAGAAREVLRMADVVEAMLRAGLDALDGDRKQLSAGKALDTVLDRLNRAIKSYLTALDPDSLDLEDNARLAEILAFATNLEHAGDVIDKGLMGAAAKRLKRGLAFSAEGRVEIRTMFERLAGNVQSAAAVFMTSDARAARRLLGEEEIFRDLEARATDSHFARIRAGRVESVETSALHLDILRDLTRINAHLTAAAYPVLDRLGELLPSRLRQGEEA